MTQVTSRFRPVALPAAVLALSLIAASGCGGAGAPVETGTISGKVTFDGAPVKAGQVVFESVDPKAPKPNTQTANFTDGSYAAGALAVGSYKIHVLPPVGADGQPAKTADDIPEKYRSATTSGLTAQIKAGLNPVDVTMTK